MTTSINDNEKDNLRTEGTDADDKKKCSFFNE